MTQQLQELINKIKTEGVQEAESKAQQILAEAEKKKEKILQKAQEEADALIEKGKNENKRMEASTKEALEHSARDMMLNLRKQIEVTLKKILDESIQESLGEDDLAGMIKECVRLLSEKGKKDSGIVVSLSDKDCEKLKKGFLKKLQGEIKNPIEFMSADDIAAGFTISFDQGKSAFDFTDKALAEFLSLETSRHFL